MGDMFPWRDAPFLDRSNGGSGVSFPETLQALIDNVDGYDTVVPGHIPVTTPESLQEYQRFTADLLAAVRGAIEAGQSAEEAAASIDLTGQYEGYRTERMAAAIGGDLRRAGAVAPRRERASQAGAGGPEKARRSRLASLLTGAGRSPASGRHRAAHRRGADCSRVRN